MSSAESIKQTKITLKSDRATGVSAVHATANINGLAFNLDYISNKDAQLALKLMELYEQARELEK